MGNGVDSRVVSMMDSNGNVGNYRVAFMDVEDGIHAWMEEFPDVEVIGKSLNAAINKIKKQFRNLPS